MSIYACACVRVCMGALVRVRVCMCARMCAVRGLERGQPALKGNDPLAACASH